MKVREVWNAMSALPMNARVVVIDGDDSADLAEVAMSDGNVVLRLAVRQGTPEIAESATEWRLAAAQSRVADL